MKKSYTGACTGIFCIAAIIIASVVFTTANPSRNQYEIGQLQKQTEEQVSKNAVCAKVNGKSITLQEVEIIKIQYQGQKTTEEVIDILVDREVAYQEAVKLGLKATDNQVEQFIAEQKKFFADNPELKQPLLDYIEGLGITEEAYWSKVHDLSYKNISVGNLKKEWAAQMPVRTEGQSDNFAENQAKEAYYQTKLKELKSAAVIELINN